MIYAGSVDQMDADAEKVVESSQKGTPDPKQENATMCKDCTPQGPCSLCELTETMASVAHE